MSFTTSNLGLTVWNKPLDDFEHTKLASNWEIIDSHDHSGPGKGVKLGTNSFEPESITSALIKFRAIGTNQLALEAVEGKNIKKNTIESSNIALGAIINELIANGTIQIGKLNPNILFLGQITFFYTATPESYTPPVGVHTPYEICDGKLWSEAKENKMGPGESTLSSGYMPNLIDKYILGTALNSGGYNATGEPIGSEGGTSSVSLEHSHTVPAHSHVVGAHAHTIKADGKHLHYWLSKNLTTRTNAFVIGLDIEGHHNELQSTYINEVAPISGGNREVPMDEEGYHDHGGNTGSAEAGTTSVALTTNPALGSSTINPPHTALLPVMRVR